MLAQNFLPSPDGPLSISVSPAHIAIKRIASPPGHQGGGGEGGVQPTNGEEIQLLNRFWEV